MINYTSKEEIIDKIKGVIKSPFEEKGFHLKRKRFFERTDSCGNVQQYEIDISKRKGYFSLHLKLNLLNKCLMKKVNSVLEKAMRDERYPFPDNWDATFIKKNIKDRTSNSNVLGLTDWREFKEEDETLEDFNERFSIWIFNFDKIDEKEGWQKQLLMSVEFALKWFSKVEGDEWIINNTVYPSLYLLKERKNLNELQEEYAQILNLSRLRKEEVELFYYHLTK